MSRPGERFTAKQLATELDRPLGTVQSAAGKLHAARMRSTRTNPVGVYAFRPTGDCPVITYAYRTDRPFDSDLHPVHDHQWQSDAERKKSKRRREKKAKAEAKAACTLTPTSIDGLYITGNGDLVESSGRDRRRMTSGFCFECGRDLPGDHLGWCSSNVPTPIDFTESTRHARTTDPGHLEARRRYTHPRPNRPPPSRPRLAHRTRTRNRRPDRPGDGRPRPHHPDRDGSPVGPHLREEHHRIFPAVRHGDQIQLPNPSGRLALAWTSTQRKTNP